MQIVHGELLELLSFRKDRSSLLSLFKIFLTNGGRSVEVVAARYKRIDLDRAFRLEIVLSKLLELLHVFHDFITVVGIIFIFVFLGGCTSEVVTAGSKRIRGDHWFLRMEIVDCELLELLHVFHDIIAVVSIVFILVFLSGSSSEVVTALGKRIALDNWFLRMEVVNCKLLELLSFHEDTSSLFGIFHILLVSCRGTRKVAASKSSRRHLDWAFRVEIVQCRLLELLGVG